MARPLTIAALLLVAAPATLAFRSDSSEAQLANRTPGKPVTCISEPQIDRTQTYATGDILYRMNDGTIYLNHPDPQCSGLSPRTGLVTRTPSTQLCRGDIAQVVDFSTGFQYGSCALNDFVPYPKPKKAQ